MSTTNYMQRASEVANANGEAIKSMFEVSLKAAQQLGELNGDLVKSFATTARNVGVSGDINASMQAQAKMFERSSEYFRDLTDVFTNTVPEIGRLNAERMNAVMDMMAEQTQQLSSTKQNGVPDMAALMKSSFFDPTAAYERMFNMTREILDSSLNAVATTSGKGVARSNGANKKAA